MGYTRSACGGITERNSSLPHHELSGADSKVSVSPCIGQATVPTSLMVGPFFFLITTHTLWLMVMIWSNASITFLLGVGKPDELELKTQVIPMLYNTK